VRRGTFLIERIRSIIADERIGHRHDLPAIRRIGQHLLIAGHGSIETNLADARFGSAKGFALENPSIFQGENCTHRRAVSAQPRNFQAGVEQTNLETRKPGVE
jgi:hypothetical protein